MSKKPTYKTWIRLNKIIIFYLISLFFIAIAILSINNYIQILALVTSLPFLYISFILTYTYYQFSSFGGNYQQKIHNLIIEGLVVSENEKILDVGTGSGALIINLAKKSPKSKFIGIDYWGDEWEYSKNQCEQNAEIEHVNDRITFIKASASNLPFEENEFDAIISCLTFHEVKDELDKTNVIKEALRVLRNNGNFVFIDLFKDEKIFGDLNSLIESIKNIGVSKVEITELTEKLYIPKLLLGKKILGNAMILIGKK